MQVTDVFSDIEDDKVLSHKSPESSLGKLIAQYSEHAVKIDRLPDMTQTSTGADLKRGIGLMAAEDQIQLAYHYLLNQGIIDDDANDRQEERRFRRRLIMTGVVVGTAFTFLMAGAVLAFTFKNDTNLEGIKAMLEYAAKIAQVIVTKEEK